MTQTSIFSLCLLFYDSLECFLQNHFSFTTLILPFYDLQEMIHTHIAAICESDILHKEGAHVQNISPEGDNSSLPYESFWDFSGISS